MLSLIGSDMPLGCLYQIRTKNSSRFGCMHLLATNLAMWIHIVIKESVLEISHVDDDHENSTQRNSTESPPLCDGFDSEILGSHTLATVNPYLSPFAIEFLLVGVCVAYAMFQKIGRG